jgi:ATP-dependent helicase/nuclease subunit B
MGAVPIALVTGPANAGKAQVVLQALRAHLARGEEAPLLVVPTDADQARYRRELAEGGLALGVRVERFQGLFGEMVRRSRLEEASLGKLARERLLASLLAPSPGIPSPSTTSLGTTSPSTTSLGVQRAVRPGLVKALVDLVAELEVARVAPERLREAIARGLASGGRATTAPASPTDRAPASRPGGELSSLAGMCDVFEAYQKALGQMNRADPELRTTRALDELRRKPALWGSTPVLLYGFDSFTELQLDAIETLGAAVDAPLIVSLPYEPGRRAFAGRASTFQRLRPLAGSHTELPARPEHYALGSRAVLHHLERSLLEELPERIEPGRAVRLLEGGSPRAELELVASDVSGLLRSGVPAEQIAIVHRSPETLGSLFTEVLEGFGVPCSLRSSERFSCTAVGRGLLGLMRCALCDGELGDLLAWLRAPGVLTHPELADRLEATARRRGASSAEQGRALWQAEHWPLDRIDRLQAAAQRGALALIDALGAELQRLFVAPRRGLGEALGADELPEPRALAAGRHALEELRELARRAAEHAPGPLELVETLEQLELPDSSLPLPGTVALVGPLSLRARRVRALFVCGMQEGVFPAPPRPHPLLSQEGRRSLALASGLLLGGESLDALERERYLLYALCSRPEERLTLSWHTAEEDGSPVARSLFVDDVCDLFDKRLSEQVKRRPAGAVQWPVAADTGSEPIGEIVVRRMGDEHAPIARREQPIDPLSDERVLEELRERTLWSASSLECFSACPVRWFVERLLRPPALDPDPEPLARGALAHAALRQTLERLRERTGSARISPASLEEARRLLGEALSEHSARHPLSASPERVPGARRRLQSELERYLEWAAENDSGSEPTHLELEFGIGEDGAALPALELGGGVSVRGRIDRIDISPQGDAVVYDYKARSAAPAAKWVSDGVLQMALYMRATERLLHHPVAGGFYQPLSGRDLRARGVLDRDAGIELDCVRTDRLEHSEVLELIERCQRAALGAAAQAREGGLEPRPRTCSPRGGCMYPTICRCES